MLSSEKGSCPVCGETHETEPGELWGFPIQTCPRVPRDHVYEDVKFDNGPPGRLHKIGGEVSA